MQVIEWGKIFLIPVTNECLLFRIHKELQVNHTTWRKMDIRLKLTTLQKRISEWFIKYMKICLISPIIREINWNPNQMYQNTYNLKRIKIPCLDEDVETLEIPHPLKSSLNLCNYFGIIFAVFNNLIYPLIQEFFWESVVRATLQKWVHVFTKVQQKFS